MDQPPNFPGFRLDLSLSQPLRANDAQRGPSAHQGGAERRAAGGGGRGAGGSTAEAARQEAPEHQGLSLTLDGEPLKNAGIFQWILGIGDNHGGTDFNGYWDWGIIREELEQEQNWDSLKFYLISH